MRESHDLETYLKRKMDFTGNLRRIALITSKWRRRRRAWLFMSHNVQSQSKKGNKKVERLKEGGETSIAVEGTTTAW